MKKYLFLLVFGLLGLALEIQAQPLLRTHVETGDVEGVADETLAVYKAIPYAAPPVGNLRWKAPQPAQAWEGVRVCDTFGPLPPQPTRPGRTADMMSEDCLYLGIATPAKSAADRLPVMVWIHGGGFQTEWYGGDLWRYLALRGVAHADDIMYLNGQFLTQPDKYPAESAVAEIIQQYWVNFAKTGNPNAKGLPFWPTFDETKPTTMQFSNGASLIMLPNREQIDFVDRFYKAKRKETESAR